jgi:hypothetical protein
VGGEAKDAVRRLGRLVHRRRAPLRVLGGRPPLRLGSGKNGLADIQAHAYWKGVEWDLLPLKKFESPCKGIKPPDKEKARKKKEKEAVKIASEMAAQDGKEDGSAPVHDWDFVSPNAIVEEYMENMYRLVSSI